jgi:hypothetical protein
MIGHDTQMRDWLNAAIRTRASTIMRGAEKAPPKLKAYKSRLDDYEQAQQLKALIGKDPY